MIFRKKTVKMKEMKMQTTDRDFDNALILASASPRRKEILIDMGFNPKIITSEFSETLPSQPYLTPKETAMYFAFMKADSVKNKLLYNKNILKNLPIVGCDTLVCNDNKILGKPKDKNDAFEMLSTLRGRTHRVISGLCILSMLPQSQQCGEVNGGLCCAVETKVSLSYYSDQKIWEYINTGDPMDKAGSYGIQGEFGKYIKSYDGSYLNVVGFPAEEFIKQINKFFNNMKLLY